MEFGVKQARSEALVLTLPLLLPGAPGFLPLLFLSIGQSHLQLLAMATAL